MDSTDTVPGKIWPPLLNIKQACDLLAQVGIEIKPPDFLIQAEQRQMNVWAEVKGLHLARANYYARGAMVDEGRYTGFVTLRPSSYDWHVARTAPNTMLAAAVVVIKGEEWCPLMPHARFDEPLYYGVVCMLFERVQIEALATEAMSKQTARTAEAQANHADAPEKSHDTNHDEPSLSPATLKEGRNNINSVKAWIAATGKAERRDDDTSDSLASRIVALAERNRYQSARGSISKETVLRHLPAGITGGRGRRSRSKN